MIKRVGSLILVLALVATLALVGCAADEPAPAPAPTDPAAPVAPAPPAEPTEPAEEPAVADFPTRPIELECSFGPGGGSDQMARVLAPVLEEELGVPIRISNTTGAGGDTGMARALANPADGYTFVFQNSNGVLAMALGISPFEEDDMIRLARMHATPHWLFLHTEDTRFDNWDDVMEYAIENPGELTIATEGLAGADEMYMLQLAELLGAEITVVPYASPGERYTALVGQHEDLLFEQIGDVIMYIEAGQIKPILLFDDKRMAGWEDVPAATEYHEDMMTHWQFRGYQMKAGTPPERVQIVADALEKAYWSDEYQAALEEWQLDPETTWMGPDEFGPYVREWIDEVGDWGRHFGFDTR